MEFDLRNFGRLVFILLFAGCSPQYSLLDGTSLDLADQQNFSDLPPPPPSLDFSELVTRPGASPEVAAPGTESTGSGQTLPKLNDSKNEPKIETGADRQANQSFDPKALDSSQALVGLGTVYYIPLYGTKRDCSESEVMNMRDENENVLVRLCKTEIMNCALQGSCYYVAGQEPLLFSYRKMVKIQVPGSPEPLTQPRFRVSKDVDRCPQGFGVRGICLDPYRSIAADPQFHQPGDVVFLPKLVGVKLPNGEVHDGFFVIRDQGGAIKGQGRFDFFIGFDDYRGHLFTELNLADKKTSQFQFYRVPEQQARLIREARRFPMVPASVQARALNFMRSLGAKTKLVAQFSTKK